MEKPLILDTPKLYAVRRISSDVQASDSDLASNGLMIGNNLDKNDRDSFRWQRNPDTGDQHREYRVKSGNWPVYLARDMEEVKRRFLQQQNDGTVIYVAEIDLNDITLGINIPYEFIGGWETGFPKEADTYLRPSEVGGKFHLAPTKSVSTFQGSLASRFDGDGRLVVKEDKINGEFFLYGDSYKRFQSERIFRFVDGEPVDVSNRVKYLRGGFSMRLGAASVSE